MKVLNRSPCQQRLANIVAIADQLSAFGASNAASPELKLSLDHSEAALSAAIPTRLSIKAEELNRLHGVPARLRLRKEGGHPAGLHPRCELPTALEAALLKRFRKDVQYRANPDTSYKYVAATRSLLRIRRVQSSLVSGPAGPLLRR